MSYSLNMLGWRVTSVADRDVTNGRRERAIFVKFVDAEYLGPLVCRGLGKRGQIDGGCGHVFPIEEDAGTGERAAAVSYADLSMGLLPVRISVGRLRARCPKCGYRFLQQLGGIDDDFRMTSRLRSVIEDKAFMPYLTFSSIAYEYGLSESTVNDVFHLILPKRLAGRVVEAPFILGIDGKQIYGKLRTVLVALGERAADELDGSKLLDILQDFNELSVVKGIQSLPNYNKIEVVAIDAEWWLRQAVRKALGPKVKIVLDRFHFQKLLNVAFRPGSVRARKAEIIEIFNQNITPQIAASYIDNWVANLTQQEGDAFVRFLSIWNVWRTEILNYFEHRITNSGTEQRNGIIQKLISIGKAARPETVRGRAIFMNSYLRDPRGPGWTSCEKCGAIRMHTHRPIFVGSAYGEQQDVFAEVDMVETTSERGFVHRVRRDGTQVPIRLVYECPEHGNSCCLEDVESGKINDNGSLRSAPERAQTDEEFSEALRHFLHWTTETPNWRDRAQAVCKEPLDRLPSRGTVERRRIFSASGSG